MALDLRPPLGAGWRFLEETGDDAMPSLAYTVPWSPGRDWTQTELVIFGEEAGRPRELSLRFDGAGFENREFGLTFRFYDPFAQPAQEFTVLRPLPYIGDDPEVLRSYELPNNALFLALAPNEPEKLDALFLDRRWILSGISARFGPHYSPGHHWSSPPEPEFPLIRAPYESRLLPLFG
jgi:hypothetical protein